MAQAVRKRRTKISGSKRNLPLREEICSLRYDLQFRNFNIYLATSRRALMPGTLET
jgi:hypothetical protein